MIFSGQSGNCQKLRFVSVLKSQEAKVLSDLLVNDFVSENPVSISLTPESTRMEREL